MSEPCSSVEASTPAGAEPTRSLSPEELKLNSPVFEVSDALVGAMGRPLLANDPVPGQIWEEVSVPLGVPVGPLRYWIQEKAAYFKKRDYPMDSPVLFLKAARDELSGWAKAHRVLIDRARYEEALQQRKAEAPVTEMRPWMPPKITMCPTCGQEAVIDGICHSEECGKERHQERAAERRTAKGGT